MRAGDDDDVHVNFVLLGLECDEGIVFCQVFECVVSVGQLFVVLTVSLCEFDVTVVFLFLEFQDEERNCFGYLFQS